MSEQFKFFTSAQDSHEHSLQTLELLYEYDDFMSSIGTLLDVGAGPDGFDTQWWATRTTRDDDPLPLNIDCTAVDIVERCAAAKLPNVRYQRQDFESLEPPKKRKFDLIWCHNSFQYAINPLSTLKHWWSMAEENAMLAIIVPQTTNLVFNQKDFFLTDHCYYHYTMVSLIYMLATSGWDCKNGHFLKKADDPWLHAVVYKSPTPPMDPKTTRWYQLAEKQLLPESAEKSVNKWGYLKQEDLVLTWLDKSITWMGKH